MKSVRVVLIVILCGFIAFLCGVLGFFLVRRGNGNFCLMGRDDSLLQTYELVLEKEIDPAGIKNIVADYGMNSNDVIFYQSSGDQIIVKEYFNFKPEDSMISTVDVNGDTLTIKGKRRNGSGVFVFGVGRNGYTEVYLPSTIFDNLKVVTISGDAQSDMTMEVADRFQVSTTSGDIMFGDVKAADIQLSTVSGDVKINAAVGNIQTSTTSGDIYIRGEEGERRISSVSGEIELDGLNGNFDLSTTSGDILVRDGSGYGHANTVSGDINVTLNTLTGNLGAGTTSGDVSLRLPEDASFDFEYSSTSGDGRTFFDDELSYNKKKNHAEGTHGDNADKEVRVSTVSGDLSISKY